MLDFIGGGGSHERGGLRGEGGAKPEKQGILAETGAICQSMTPYNGAISVVYMAHSRVREQGILICRTGTADHGSGSLERTIRRHPPAVQLQCAGTKRPSSRFLTAYETSSKGTLFMLCS
ncbi:MAG: hypothetical protein ABL907_11575, partial [Hyphomicrobium sp.]